VASSIFKGEPEAGTSLAMATGGPVECDQIDSDVSSIVDSHASPCTVGYTSGTPYWPFAQPQALGA
jgi:hypothetical protein